MSTNMFLKKFYTYTGQRFERLKFYLTNEGEYFLNKLYVFKIIDLYASRKRIKMDQFTRFPGISSYHTLLIELTLFMQD